MLQPLQLPYAPHITKNPIYEFLFAHDLVHIFKPVKYYIDYDFETLETVYNSYVGGKTTINSHLSPFMVS